MRAVRFGVLLSVRPGDVVENPYVEMFESSLAPHCDVARFTWARALFGRYDVFHVHWPETLVRTPSAVRRLAYGVCTVLLLVRLRRTRRPLVRTMHNVAPHQASPSVIERVVLWLIDRNTTARVYMNRSEPFDTRSFNYVFPHPSYRSWFTTIDRARPDPSATIFFGRLRPYKNADQLLAAFADTTDPALRLSIVGRPDDERSARVLAAIADSDSRVALDLGHMPDDALATRITKSASAVFPYERLYNSGAVVLALSLGRPVILPEGPVATELTAEFGPEWIIRYVPPLTGPVLERAMAQAGNAPLDNPPSMHGREWAEQGRRLAEIYGQLRRVDRVI